MSHTVIIKAQYKTLFADPHIYASVSEHPREKALVDRLMPLDYSEWTIADYFQLVAIQNRILLEYTVGPEAGE